MNITVTVTLAPEIIELVKSFLSVTKQPLPPVPQPIAPSTDNSTHSAHEVNETGAIIKKIENIPAPERSADGVVKTAKKAEKKETAKNEAINIEFIKDLVTIASNNGKRETVKSMLTEYGINRVSELEPHHYAAFVDQLEKL